MIDSYSLLEAVYKILIPEAIPAMLATAVFVLITAWNEFIFALRLNPDSFSTVPPYLVAVIGYGHPEWARMAATSVVFLLPIVIFTVLVRNHLLREVASTLRIEHVLKRRPNQLASGEQQRIALGRAMVRRPQVFLMDEPLTNLDASMRADMRVELKHLQSDLGVTMIYVTHDQTE